jgi:hypothetical protein
MNHKAPNSIPFLLHPSYMRFEVFTVVNIQVKVFQAVTPCSFVAELAAFIFRVKCSEDGGSKVLQNVGILLQHHITTQPRRQLEFIPLMYKYFLKNKFMLLSHLVSFVAMNFVPLQVVLDASIAPTAGHALAPAA